MKSYITSAVWFLWQNIRIFTHINDSTQMGNLRWIRHDSSRKKCMSIALYHVISLCYLDAKVDDQHKYPKWRNTDSLWTCFDRVHWRLRNLPDHHLLLAADGADIASPSHCWNQSIICEIGERFSKKGQNVERNSEDWDQSEKRSESSGSPRKTWRSIDQVFLSTHMHWGLNCYKLSYKIILWCCHNEITSACVRYYKMSSLWSTK